MSLLFGLYNVGKTHKRIVTLPLSKTNNIVLILNEKYDSEDLHLQITIKP
jgi:hypothetical protein